MKSYCLILVGLIILSISNALHAQQFDWVKTIGNGDYIFTEDIAEDSEGNIYITGYFTDTLDIDPGTEEYLLISPKDTFSTFILKLDAKGNLVWAKSIEKARGYIIIPSDLGNIFVSGSFENETVDFDPGTGVFNITSSWISNTFFLKLNSEGELLWAKAITKVPHTLNTNPFSLDEFENVYITGEYIGDITLLPDNDNIGPLNTNLNAFVLKTNYQGEVQWFKSFEGDFSVGSNIHVDNNLNVYSSGYFTDNIDFDPGIGVYNVSDTNVVSHYINKLDSEGNFEWVNTFSGDYNDNILTITTDTFRNVYAGGGFYSDSIDFNLSNVGDIHKNNGSVDCFILKYDKNGNYCWAKTFGGEGPDNIYKIGVNHKGIIFIVGVYSGVVDFDLSDGIREKQSTGQYGVFLLVTDSLGKFYSVNTIEGDYLGTDDGIDIHINDSSILLTSEFQGVVDFDPSDEEYVLEGKEPQDLFFTKWNLSCLQSSATIDTFVCANDLTIDSYFYNESGTYYYTIPNNQGCDSLIQLNLTLYPIINTTVDIIDNTLIANEIDCEYQWINCNDDFTIIDGETSKEFTPSTNGEYAVQIAKNECLVTSPCYSYLSSGLVSSTFKNLIRVYPNPTTKNMTIQMPDYYENVNVRIYNYSGTYLKELEFQNGEKVTFDLGETQGYYFIEIRSNSQMALIKAIKL